MSQKYNHLFHLKNTQENRDLIKSFNKNMKAHNSKWKFRIKYRKPKEGFKYGSGGSLKCQNANAFSVYIDDRRPYGQRPENQYRSKLWEENRKLEEENERLKKELAIYSNPYIDWSETSIENEIFEVKESIIERYLESDDGLKDDTLKEKYNELMEALEYAEKHD